LVETCISSWEEANPDWQLRCLDAGSIEKFIPIRDYIDPERQALTAASLSDVVRLLLLREFGGVWVDATLLCNRPIDEWLPRLMGGGFFGFSNPAPDRPLSSWFLSADCDNHLVAAWTRRMIEYWAARRSTDDYFWLHHLFRDMCETDPDVAHAWARVPKISADGPHALQAGSRMLGPAAEAQAAVDWSTPVFKLTHRLPKEGIPSGSLLQHVLDRATRSSRRQTAAGPSGRASPGPVGSFAALKVSTENLGDHIQIISGLRLMSRLGIRPARFIDRDDEIMSAPGLAEESGPVGILLNGWFKTNRLEWPPHPKLVPIILGFHVRLFQCPELVSDTSIEYFRKNQPIGCRDTYTTGLLRGKGVEAFTSNCLSITFPRRGADPDMQTECFVVSRDDRIRRLLPQSLGPYTFISHYSGTNDFAANMAQAEHLLGLYQSRARLMVTTLLHCALPAIAMGIPVVVFYPINDEAGHASDRERFSALDRLVPVYRVDQVDQVDWDARPIDVSEVKLQLLDRFYEMTARLTNAQPPPFGPIAPVGALPPPV
jgi:hypothetical protein